MSTNDFHIQLVSVVALNLRISNFFFKPNMLFIDFFNKLGR